MSQYEGRSNFVPTHVAHHSSMVILHRRNIAAHLVEISSGAGPLAYYSMYVAVEVACCGAEFGLSRLSATRDVSACCQFE